VSPFGNLYGLPTLLDPCLRPDTWIVLEAGTHVEAVLLSCADYERLSGSFRLPFARHEQDVD
jgi:prolyl-tRNA editing enzyme YbaK/EbsC (Cys-tRNA(Pro) deacylase)